MKYVAYVAFIVVSLAAIIALQQHVPLIVSPEYASLTFYHGNGRPSASEGGYQHYPWFSGIRSRQYLEMRCRYLQFAPESMTPAMEQRVFEISRVLDDNREVAIWYLIYRGVLRERGPILEARYADDANLDLLYTPDAPTPIAYRPGPGCAPLELVR